MAKVAQKNTKLIIDEQSKEYWKWRDSILAYEELMLETLTFDLMIDNPYSRLHEQLEQLDLLSHRTLRDSAWAFCNDACLTVLPLMLSARDIAVAAIFFATSVTRERIDDVHGEAWWQFLKASETNTVRAAQLMTEFYKENPLRKQDTKVPGSPQFNLESTRRRGELSLSQMELDSSQYGTPTPLGTDRGGTQSPRVAAGGGRVNGRTENHDSYAYNNVKEVVIKKEDGGDSAAAARNGEALGTAAETSSSSQIEIASQMSRGDSDAMLKVAANNLSVHERSVPNGLVSPGVKRKSVEPEAGEEREAKKARLDDEDEDEGEITGT